MATLKTQKYWLCKHCRTKFFLVPTNIGLALARCEDHEKNCRKRAQVWLCAYCKKPYDSCKVCEEHEKLCPKRLTILKLSLDAVSEKITKSLLKDDFFISLDTIDDESKKESAEYWINYIVGSILRKYTQ